MYGLFTKMGAGAVFSAGLSVLGLGYLCTDQPSNRHHHRPAAVVALHADAAVGAGVVSSPSHGPSNHPGNSSPGSNNPGNANPGANTNPGSTNPGANSNPGSTNPGPNHPAPDCGCATHNPPLVNVKPDVDVDVVVTLPDTDVNAPGLVGGVLGTVGTVVDVVLPDCGCSPVGDLPAALPLPLLGH